ncbi:MAG: hypothetical protein JSV11_06310 [Nitrospiraceae bacterium]|nr:MAG: hypothetical protein JSV11_06310 [Nitrospiraceae bacterium]
MTYKVIIGVGMMVMLMLFTGSVNAVEMWPFTINEKIEVEKEYAETKCDPCDYNIDYGDTFHPGEKAGIDEGIVKLECDPCDYNADYGETSSH